MPNTNEQLIRALERRLDLTLSAPSERFNGELAAFLAYIISQTELRGIVSAALDREGRDGAARQAAGVVAAQEYAIRAVKVARALARALQPRLADSTLPQWVGPLLQGYDQARAQAEIEGGNTPWFAIRTALEPFDIYSGEVARLLSEALDIEARWLEQRAAAERATSLDFTDTLARLWGHVRQRTFLPMLVEWHDTLGMAAERAREQSSLALLRHELSGAGAAGDTMLRAALCHDLRRLSVALVDALDAHPPVQPVLDRFRRWCEVYERAALLRRSRPGKKATAATRKSKHELISAEVMRYLYAAGFTPLTLEMLAGDAAALLDVSRPLLVKVLTVGERDPLLRGYVTCVQALRGSDRARRLGLSEAFLIVFLVEPAARFVEPAPMLIAGTLLRSVFIDLTGAPGSRQPLGVETIAARIAEEDRLFEFLNTASEAALDAIAGIGPAKIQRIIAARPYAGEADLERAGLTASGALYEALRERALLGMQTLVTG
jgi:hypothetical protein